MTKQITKIKKDLNEHLDKKIANWESRREKIESLELPEFSIDPKAEIDLFGDIDLSFPYSPETNKEIRELMKSDEWSEHDMMQVHQICKYYKDGISVDVRFSINHEDSTCVKTKIGEKEQTVSIYEVTCKEGAEEKTFVHKEVEENE